MGVWANLKSRFGFGAGWDDEYINEEIETAETQQPDGDESQDSAADDRFYTYESPYASGAAPSAVTKHVRRPDMERASAAIGAPLREVATSAKPDTRAQSQGAGTFRARPQTFDDMSVVADRFKTGVPVVLDLSFIEDASPQRFIDFAAGLVYGLDGAFSRNATNSYLLIPHAGHSRRGPGDTDEGSQSPDTKDGAR
jgi:FtsZ-interacting cell division protein YlmF